MKKKIKRITNGVIALIVAQTPLLFADTHIMLVVFILGLLAVFTITYCMLELINH